MRQRIAFLCVLPLVFLIIAGSQPSAAGTAPEAGIPPRPLPVWRSEVAAPGVALDDRGMALDPDGRPHVAYGRNQLFHAWRDGESWQVETVDPDGGALTGPVIAINDAGTITIVAYTEASHLHRHLVAYSRAPGGEWQMAPIYVPWVDSYPRLALALDGDGRPHLVTTGRTADYRPLLIYTHTSPSGWVSQSIAIEQEPIGRFFLALDRGSQPVVLYQSHSGDGLGVVLRLARRGAAGWTNQSIANATFINGESLALDAVDRAHVVFSSGQPNRLVYLRQTDNGWETLVEAGDSYSPSLALDAADRPHVAYTNFDKDLVYAVLGSGGWERTTIPMVGHGGSDNTLLLDATGAAHISTMQYGLHLYYATNRGGAWVTMPVTLLDTVGEKQALALDTDNRPYLLYYHRSAGQLRWAAKEGDTWVTSTVAGVAPTGLEIALAIGPDGVPQMAYVDAAQNQVITGSWQAGHWSLAPLTTAGHSLRLAVGQDNRPHLSLIQQGRLIYWTRQGGVWQSEPASPTGVTVGDAFLGLDSQGRPKVVYGGSGVEGLVVAVRQGAGQWTTESLPNRALLAMALGPGDAVYGLYITSRFEPGKPPWEFVFLWLAEQQGGDWQDSLLYEDRFMDRYPDGRLLFDAAGRLHIVNYGNGDRLYYHQRDVDGQWSSEGVPIGGGAFALAVGSDGQPRVSSQVMSDLRLYTREILWLDQHALLPVIPVKSNTE